MNSHSHRQIWNRFCKLHQIRETLVPLFATSPKGDVLTKRIGNRRERTVLQRSEAMESLIRNECAKLIEDWRGKTHFFDGMLYLMGVDDPNGVVPLYIGKAETFGRGSGNLSANIRGIERDTSKFVRWGDNYAYHIGI